MDEQITSNAEPVNWPLIVSRVAGSLSDLIQHLEHGSECSEENACVCGLQEKLNIIREKAEQIQELLQPMVLEKLSSDSL